MPGISITLHISHRPRSSFLGGQSTQDMALWIQYLFAQFGQTVRIYSGPFLIELWEILILQHSVDTMVEVIASTKHCCTIVMRRTTWATKLDNKPLVLVKPSSPVSKLHANHTDAILYP